MNKPLRECPFCGGEVSIALCGDGFNAWWIITRGHGENACKCRLFMESEKSIAVVYKRLAKFNKDSEMADFVVDDLIAAWNRRAELDINGDTSDGYHTFNELYHHRAVLFSVICKIHHEIAWKSKQHHDGTMYNGMFIVGIETPEGQATYHYDINPYWDMFRVPELPKAPEWDGHTPEQAITRIGRLP